MVGKYFGTLIRSMKVASLVLLPNIFKLHVNHLINNYFKFFKATNII